MGVDFTAVIDHRLSGDDLDSLPERLNTSWELPAALAPWVAAHVRSGPDRWRWDPDTRFNSIVRELLHEEPLWLHGPHGFHGRMFKEAIWLTHLARWWSFLHDREVQVGLQGACRLVASIVGAEHILYLPDSSFPPSVACDVFYDGGNVSDALAWLQSEVGAPLPDPAAFLGRENEERDARGWFYERASR